MLLKQKRYYIALAALLFLLSFVGTSFLSYFAAKQSYSDYIRDESLPLASQNIYSDIQKDIIPAITISRVMANDAFVLRWYEAGEKDVALIQEYLKKIHQQFNTTTAFFISENTHNYYHFNRKEIKKVEENNPDDRWYFDIKNSTEPLVINVDKEFRTDDKYLMFVDYRVVDKQGKFAGVIGVGLSLDVLREHLIHYQKKYKRTAYFLNQYGQRVIKFDATQLNIHPIIAKNIQQYSSLKLSQKQNIPVQEFTDEQGKKVFASIRYIPQLNWYFVVEETEEVQTKLRQSLVFNIVIAFLMTFLLMSVLQMVFGKYHDSLHKMATQDWLTGLYNRQYCEALLQKHMDKYDEENKPASVLLLDVDHFKKINDNHGHATGDSVLKAIANTINDNVTVPHFTCRWGGEEFLMVLPATNLQDAQTIANDILNNVRQSKPIDNSPIKLSISCGVCQMANKEPADAFFKRLDNALYQAKDNGRDRVEVG